MSKTRRVLLMLLALALLRCPLGMLLAAMLPDVSVNPVPQCAAGMVLSVLLMGLPAWLLRPWTSTRLRKAKAVWPGMVLGAVAALLTRTAMLPVDEMWQSWLNLTPDAVPVPESIPIAMLYIAALMVVPALMEEAFFRGAVMTGLLDGSQRMMAVLMTALPFVFMHGSLVYLPSLLVLSLTLTLLMLHTGHIAAPVTAHLVYNLTAVAWTAPAPWVSGVCGALLTALAVRICLSQPKYAHQPMKRLDGMIAGATFAVLAVSYFV